MFSTPRIIACLQFTRTRVFCALSKITGRRVDILAFDEISVESGILEEGIIYDIEHLQKIVKNLITSVSRNQSKIDAAWFAIPDNKIKITNFDIIKEKNHTNEYELQKIIEDKFNSPISKLYLINRPIHDLNQRVFYLANAIRTEHLDPFLKLLEPLEIPITAIFPTFQCIWEELRDQFVAPTLLLYPSGKSYKFFIADQNGVYLDSIWGHNLIEPDSNLDKAILEIVEFAKKSRDIALGVKKVLVLESPNHDSENLQMYLRRTGLDFAWIPSDAPVVPEHDYISLIVLKGLIKCSMRTDFNKGFLQTRIIEQQQSAPGVLSQIKNKSQLENSMHSSTFANTLTTMSNRYTQYKNLSMMENRWNLKTTFISILLSIVLLGSIAYAGWRIAERVAQRSESNGNQLPIISSTTPTTNVSITATQTNTPTPTPTQTVTPTATPTPMFTKSDVKVLVLNGNNRPGEASLVTGILQSNGFITKAPDNAQERNVPTTTVSFKDQRSKNLAEEIVKLIENRYPSAKAVYDPNINEDILVVLGIR
ncbi:MAG: hypothetical protein KatS3mg084_0618 [Candidatus Dojkabacteria bacterium]|nr:MAG: hypothetical protein KatS3mg084_0618 [Candidatus Dojkabacteria bacterium]